MKLFGFDLTRVPSPRPAGRAVARTSKPADSGSAASRVKGVIIDASLFPEREMKKGSMSYRAVFEMIANEVLKDLRLNRGQADVEILRIRTVNDLPKYQVVMIANVKQLVNVEVMGEFQRHFHRSLRVISPPSETALQGLSWQLSPKLNARDGHQDFQQTRQEEHSPFPSQPQPSATDFGTF